MNNLDFIRGKVGLVIITGLLIASFSFLFLVVNERNFRASTDFLVVQDQTGTQDFYSLSKSAEYLGNVLSEAIYSSVFIEEMIKTEKVDSSFFPSDKKEQIEKWGEEVKIKQIPQLGIVKVEVYDDSKANALRVSEGISEIMTQKNYLFRGKVGLDVRILSGPIIEKNPSIEKIGTVVLGGFLLGALLSIIWSYYSFLKRYREEKEYLESLSDLEQR